MVCSSLLFTFLFLPMVLFLYFLAKEKYRNYILLIASLLFYAYGEPIFVWVMIASILINYGIAIWLDYEKECGKYKYARNLMILDVFINLGILYIFKYYDFSISIINQIFDCNILVKKIALPIGISFFTFQALSYVIDVYRGTVSVQKNPMYVALYISFFPQLVAGPIVRYSTIEKEITERVHTIEKFADGIKRFFIGFSKKILLANNLAVVASEIQKMDIDLANPLLLWMGAVCYTLQIFYDFAGYSDMAIGLGKMFGFTFEENFNYPYISKSVTEFWRRWHISLGQWFRDYVYIPLGGSRVKIPRHLVNLFVVWMLTGIWHGANFTFIVWGFGYFVLLVIEKFWVKPEKRKNFIFRSMWQIITLICVNFGWVIFNAVSLKSGVKYCLAMLGYYSPQFMVDANICRYLREYGFFIFFGIIFVTPVMKVIGENLEQSKNLGLVKAILSPVGYGILFLISVSYLILGAHNPFIYFNF